MRTEVVFAGTIIVAWNSQVHCVADIGAELDLVVAFHLRPVVHKLELLLAFGEGTVTTSNTQTLAEAGNDQALFSVVRRAVIAADRILAKLKRSLPACLRIAGVGIGDPECRHRLAATRLLRLWVVFERKSVRSEVLNVFVKPVAKL